MRPNKWASAVSALLSVSSLLLALSGVANAQSSGLLSLSEVDCGTRKACTRLTGVMRLEGQGTVRLEQPEDPYSDEQCPVNYQCVDSAEGMVGMDTNIGCCDHCGSHQTCRKGTVGMYDQSDRVNVCPGGHLCNPTPQQCEAGFICQRNIIQNCTELRERARDIFQVGDIHAGIYCKKGSSNIAGCPAGSYCPNATTMVNCSAGYYCPYKSLVEDEFKCDGCGEAATEIKRSNATVVFYIIAPIVLFVFVIYRTFKRWRKEENKEASRLKADRESYNRARRDSLEQKLKNIEPKLREIQVKIESLIEEDPELVKRSASAEIFDSSQSSFNEDIHSRSLQEQSSLNAASLFDFLDADGSNDLTYAELNTVLGLNEYKLQAFVKVMNSLGGHPESDTSVTKECFVEHFLTTLELSDNFGPTVDQTVALYDEICALSPGDTTFHIEDFYNSRLQDFLDDIQINDMLKKLRDGGKAVFVSNRVTVSKEDFVAAYPDILNKIALSDGQTIHQKVKGIDLAFESLCLEVSVAKKKN
mmetsp:Transcript_6704/g.9802  ORF Transcript_6704/g.9802 Transcript_6704/m.9802 type:complete len:530 (-) Transcript_6704:13-1602(-)